MNLKIFCLTVVAFYFSCVSHIMAVTMISNLNQIWPGGDMGNFRDGSSGYGYGFMFGTGANPYGLNTVTLEKVKSGENSQLGIYTVQGDPRKRQSNS